MNNNFYNSIVAKANQDYLESMQKTINQLMGCIVEKIIYTAIYGENYILYKPIIDIEVNKIIDDIKKLPEIIKYNILSIFLNITNLCTADKIDLFVDISTTTVKDEIDSNIKHEYLVVEFPFKHNLEHFDFSIVEINSEISDITNSIFDRIIELCFCNNKEYHLDNNKNRLYTFIKPDEILLIGNNEVKNITLKDLLSVEVNTDDSNLDLSLVLNPLLECLESNHDALSLNIFSKK